MRSGAPCIKSMDGSLKEVDAVRIRDLFPQEVVSDVPRVTLTGDSEAHVEQHHGLIAYQPEEVAFRTGTGVLKIRGAGLRFRLYSVGEAVLTGRIDSVLLDGGKRGEQG